MWKMVRNQHKILKPHNSPEKPSAAITWLSFPSTPSPKENPSQQTSICPNNPPKKPTGPEPQDIPNRQHHPQPAPTQHASVGEPDVVDNLFQRFQKGVGGRGLGTNTPLPLLLRGHRKKGTEKRPGIRSISSRQPLVSANPFSKFLIISAAPSRNGPFSRKNLPQTAKKSQNCLQWGRSNVVHPPGVAENSFT